MRKIYPLFIALFVLGTINVSAQHQEKCATEKAHEIKLRKAPGLVAVTASKEAAIQHWLTEYRAGKMDTLPTIITVPVVVHVIYKAAIENIGDSQVISQIERLNLDYRKQNSDTLAPTHPYYSRAGDSGFEFCLAQFDPQGNPSTGITRTLTTKTRFNPDTDGDDNMKFTVSGGIDSWDPHQYLNIWVCNLDTNYALGYTAYPSDLDSFPDYDGTVIGYRYFGTTSNVQAPNALGRTATHEIGHWLDLIHIWGDSLCGNDSVADTPTQADANYDCPTFPSVTCSNGPNGDMFMNYMDYVDDACMDMFTVGQGARMRAALTMYRLSILQSTGCQLPVNTGVKETEGLSVKVMPNPSDGNMTVKLTGYSGKATLELYDLMGREIWAQQTEQAGTNVVVHVSDAASGIYILKVKAGNETMTQKVIIR